MNKADFDFFSALLRREAGVLLTHDKTYLLESRLLPVAAERGLQGLAMLADKMRREDDPDTVCAVVEAMMTSETSFFRDRKPFETLRDVLLPYYMLSRRMEKRLRIWSAACASGQEPYSIAMLLAEAGVMAAGWQVDILGTDISGAALKTAEKGVYSQFEAQRGLPAHLLIKYFTQTGADRWRVKDDLRGMVRFRQLNLLTNTVPGSFDIVFCRNVLIYLDTAARVRALASVRRCMQPDAALFLGAAEKPLQNDGLRPLKDLQGVFARTDAPASFPF